MEFAEAFNDNLSLFPLRQTWTKQVGIVFGGEMRHRLMRGFSIYLGGNIAYTEGDYYRSIENYSSSEVNEWDVHMYEAGTGFQIDRCLPNGTRLQFRSGADFINYQNIATDYIAAQRGGMLGGWLDTEFNGFSFRFSIAR